MLETPGRPRPADVLAAFFICGAAFLAAAAIIGICQWVSPWPWGRWLALHLAFVGGVSQLVLGASQFFAAAFLATDPPPRRLIRAQLLAWNGGAILLVIATPEQIGALRWLAIGLLITGLISWAAAIRAIRRAALRHFSWATRWYVACAACLGFGVVAGSLLAGGHYPTGGNLLGAHMVLNLCGWFGAAIVGTLHTFFPSLTGTQLSYPRLQGPTFVAWLGGVGLLAVGYAWGLGPLILCGWLGLATASGLLAFNLISCMRRVTIPLSLPARLIGFAQVLLVAGMVLIVVLCLVMEPTEALSGSWRTVIGTLLVSGWIGLTVLASMLHLLAVVIRVRAGFAPMPKPRPRFDLALSLYAFLAVAALAVGQAAGFGTLAAIAGPAAAGAYLLIGGLTAQRVMRVLTTSSAANLMP